MKVKHLINMLQQLPQDADVCVRKDEFNVMSIDGNCMEVYFDRADMATTQWQNTVVINLNDIRVMPIHQQL